MRAREAMMLYEEFLGGKRRDVAAVGFDPPQLHPLLFPFQADTTRWAIRQGRAAIFADCGMGKTLMQLEWARHVHERTGKPILILAPLAVSHQTMREGEKLGLSVRAVRSAVDVRPGLNITNYEMLHKFTPEPFGGIVLDESSILKGFDGVFRREITNFSEGIGFRLACTATPAPNDLIELTNHAEFLGVASGREILGLYFVQDGNTTHKWRLRGHAEVPFWKWLATWAVAMRRPSDLGYEDGAFILPALTVHEHVVDAHDAPDGYLFPIDAEGLQDRRNARRASMSERVALAASLVAREPNEQWLIWCDLNAESDALTRAIPGAVEVKGADSFEHKESSMLGFSDGSVRVLVTKPTIAGHGMNWQNCSRAIFVGLSDSYEQYYQAVRRCWRFGQERPVDVHLVIGQREGAVRENIARKEQEAMRMFDNLTEHMKVYQLGAIKPERTTEEDVAEGEGWRLMLGDSMKRMAEVASGSVGLSVFSPPFPGMYVYTDSPADVGNCATIGQLIEHFRYFMPELLRITMPGRSCCVHLTQAVAFKGADGYIGIKDFRGRVIEEMEAAGWIYYGEVTIDKDPQVKAIRTKDAGLLFKSLSTDSARMHMALADYIIQFRKPGDNPAAIRAGISSKYGTAGWITAEEWIEWAAPVWYRQTKEYPGGIRETDVLNVRAAREDKDEKHLCPLQLGVIERCIKLWSAPGDTVFSPFAGIGSEGYQAIRLGRKFIGCELKRSYWTTACENLRAAERTQGGLFAEAAP